MLRIVAILTSVMLHNVKLAKRERFVFGILISKQPMNVQQSVNVIHQEFCLEALTIQLNLMENATLKMLKKEMIRSLLVFVQKIIAMGTMAMKPDGLQLNLLGDNLHVLRHQGDNLLRLNLQEDNPNALKPQDGLKIL